MSESNVLSCLCVGHISKGTGTKFSIALVGDLSLYLHGTLAVTICSLSYVTKNLGTANRSVQVAIKKKQLFAIQK